jgi:CrcB protein
VDKLIQVGALSLGGVLGVNARFWLGILINRWTGPQFPWATFVINVTGSFFIGFLTMVLSHWLPHPNLRLMVITGFLGGYTTFSTFAFESLTLWERGERGLSFGYMAGSVAAGFLAVALGVGLAQSVTIPREERTAATNPEASVDPEANGQAGDDGAARKTERAT